MEATVLLASMLPCYINANQRNYFPLVNACDKRLRVNVSTL